MLRPVKVFFQRFVWKARTDNELSECKGAGIFCSCFLEGSLLARSTGEKYKMEHSEAHAASRRERRASTAHRRRLRALHERGEIGDAGEEKWGPQAHPLQWVGFCNGWASAM